MSENKVYRLFKIWQKAWGMEAREKAWEEYCKARDEAFVKLPEKKQGEPDLRDVFDAFEDMPN